MQRKTKFRNIPHTEFGAKGTSIENFQNVLNIQKLYFKKREWVTSSGQTKRAKSVIKFGTQIIESAARTWKYIQRNTIHWYTSTESKKTGEQIFSKPGWDPKVKHFCNSGLLIETGKRQADFSFVILRAHSADLCMIWVTLTASVKWSLFATLALLTETG